MPSQGSGKWQLLRCEARHCAKLAITAYWCRQSKRECTRENIMNVLFLILGNVWYLWCHLFDPLPYGNPYGAILAAVLLLAALGKVIKEIMMTTCR